MITTDFSYPSAGVIGTIRRGAGRGYDFDRALYSNKLSVLYPVATGPENAENSAGLTAWSLFAAVMDFSTLAAHIVTLAGAPFDWPSARDTPTAIDQAFRYVLEDESGLFDHIRAEILLFDNPNGAAAGRIEDLPKEQQADPL